MAAFITFLIVLNVLGLVNASYLAWKHMKKQPLICPLNHDCDAVTQSKWSKFIGLRNEIWGILYYAVLLILIWFFIEKEAILLKLAIFVFSEGALAYSAFLFYVQKYVLKMYCFYCLISAVINALIFIFACWFLFY